MKAGTGTTRIPDSDYFDEVQIEFVDGVITKIEVDNATLPAGQ